MPTPPSPHHRPKAPDAVRQALLQSASDVISQRGLAGFTVQDVARGAGVSKGALFHHFASKQALLDAALQAVLGQFWDQVQALMQADPEPWGRFSRAYVRATFDNLLDPACDSPGFSLGTCFDSALMTPWRAWLRARLAEHPAETSMPRLLAARCVADGYWLQAYGTPLHGQQRDEAIALSREALRLCTPD
ncbi:MAG: HTH-type transcriptional repressor KstR2 [Stenotrophomonas maltophilia]|uniref:HTH-type transcriptional repressor KstR2 n=1 Tax=Stenotrophomonas maltophilia TaxID=40324 RepID=A0A7V8JLY6_STEMA|nr:MAG: HTH-type transcriptional repressor KstR2 [Stenotrophomonas maltophilia]